MQINKFLTQYNRTISNNKKNKWIVIHYTANNGDTAKGNCNYFSKPLPKGHEASANYFVDEKEIWQCVEDKDIAWHVGAHKYYNDCRNDNSIGIELCSRIDSNGHYYFKDKTILNAIELTKMLMKKYDIDINHVCRHYDVTRKICPAPFVYDTKAWQQFLDRLKDTEEKEEEEMNELYDKYGRDVVNKAISRLVETFIDDGEPSGWAKSEVDKAKEMGITDGSNPEMWATRQEVMMMVARGIDIARNDKK